MSAFNWFETERKAFDLRTKELTTSATNTTYTAKTGTAATTGIPTNEGIMDRVIVVDTTSESSMTITVPDGRYYGQELLIILEVLGGSATVDVTTDTGDDATQMTAAGGYWLGMWHGDTLGWATIAGSAT